MTRLEEVRKYFENNIHNISYSDKISKITVEDTGDGYFTVHIVPKAPDLIFEDVKIPCTGGAKGSWRSRRKAALKKLREQEGVVISAYTKGLDEKIAALGEKWRKEHPLTKKMKDFLQTEAAKVFLSEDGVTALTKMTIKTAFSIEKFSLTQDGRISIEVMDFPYRGTLDLRTGKLTSPFARLTAIYNKIEYTQRDVDTLKKISSYLREKNMNASAEYTKKPARFRLHFHFDTETEETEIETEGTFKKLVSAEYRKAAEKAREKRNQKEASLKALPVYGTFLSEAVIRTVSENKRLLTENQIVDILRGVKLKEDYSFGKSTGMYNILPAESIHKEIKRLISGRLAYELRIDGKYQDYFVICLTPDAYVFQGLQTLTTVQRSPKTEQEYHLYVLDVVRNKKHLTLKKEKELIDMFCSYPGVFCADPHTALDLAELMSEKAKAYLKKRTVTEEDGPALKILKYLYGAACGKRKDLPKDGADVVRRKREAEIKKKKKEELKKAEERRRDRELMEKVLTEIPEDYVDIYPYAREMKRHFVLHIGPTNSGKTYTAIEDLMRAETGIYLAPLRLLAFEQYEKMNKNGCPCSLVTGEEQYMIEGARHQSSTIEMLDTMNRYDVAVIDEAQMIADKERGGAWAAAVMGVRADTVHVCAAAEAEDILRRIIVSCGDEIEVIKHERMTPLVFENKKFSFPKDVRSGDALIVFSRKNVHAVASELQKIGIKCSIIYGALPYDVRHRQAEMFAGGETNVVVATDAIGMGMNLPIKRVVLMETKKFDGTDIRWLKDEEVRQIAGRAGRYGIYDTGYVAVANEAKNFVERALRKEPEQVTNAMIGFPESLLPIDATMVELIRKWIQVVPADGWEKESVEQMLRLAILIEGYKAPKKISYDFLTIPFDDEDPDLLNIWLDAFAKIVKGKDYDLYHKTEEMHIAEVTASESIAGLEKQHKKLDLYFNLARKFQPQQKTLELIMEKKKECSTQIMNALKKYGLKGRRCRFCGRSLSWNYPYGMCQKCHDRMYPGYYGGF